MRPPVPSLDELASDVVTHHYDDMVAPAGLTNLRGTVVVGPDLVGVRGVAFPPLGQGGAGTGALFVDGRLFESYGVPIDHSWRPDRVVRSARLGDLVLESTTVCVPDEDVVAIDVVVRNSGAGDREVGVALSLAARVTRRDAAWSAPELPDAPNAVEVDDGRLVFHDAGERAWSVQAVDVPALARTSGVADSVDAHEVGIGGVARGGEISLSLDIPAGEERRFGLVLAVGASRGEAGAAAERVLADVPAAIEAAERFWTDRIRALVDPPEGEYAGRLPVLETSDAALRRLYWWGALGTLWFRREYAGAVRPRTYDTLMPNYWATTTFIWDYSLSSMVHALVDPSEMRQQLVAWIGADIHSMFGTSALDGAPVGRWYSVNDYAMTRLVHDYVRVTGDDSLLDERIAAGDEAERTVAEHLVSWARAWRGLRRGGALADYGEIDNLLECVSSYTHEVASLNAANVWCLRTAAALVETRLPEEAERMRAEAEELLPHVLDLYVPDVGCFAARQPDGTRLPVRHVYDFNVVGTTIAGDLPEPMRREMVDFFVRELRTDTWLHALSPSDPDASFSVRPDHQWNGAYPAWPADAGRALAALGASDVLLGWLDGLARSANQGPPGQAHFVEEAEPAIAGGARKAPPQLPYINDWACSSAGSWVQLVIEGVFGLRADAGATPSAGGGIAALDPEAVVRGVTIGGRLHDVHADGRIVPSGS